MSQENVEIWRANIEGQLAELTAGTSPEATISKMAEIWDPEVELDATEAHVLDIARSTVGPTRFGSSGFSARAYTATMDEGLGSADFLDELIPVDEWATGGQRNTRRVPERDEGSGGEIRRSHAERVEQR